MNRIKVSFSKVVFLSVVLANGVMGCTAHKTEKVNVVRSVSAVLVPEYQKEQAKVFSGIIKESREVKLAFQVPGSLINLSVDEGQYVKKGDLIAGLDPRDYEVQLASVNANFEQAKLQADRYAALYEKQSTSKSVYDQTQAAYKLAKAQKEAAENALNDTQIYAPFSGYIQMKFAENHEKVGAGQPIVSVLDLKNLEVIVSLSEADYLMCDRFEAYSCSVASLNQQAIALDLIDIDKKPEGGQFFKMRLRIEDGANQKLMPGMVCKVTVLVRNQNSDQICKVPVEAVFGKQNNSYVWVLDASKSVVMQQKVETGSLDSTGMIEVKSGINPGEYVITAGVHSLKNKQKVKLIEASSKTNVGGQL